jgi:hypothetical protein
MSEKIAFVDTLRNSYDNSPNEKKEEMKGILKKNLEDFCRNDLNARVDRWLEPPSMGVIDVTNTRFKEMLYESIMCYVHGFYYSTIAICGITAERLCMDILLRHKLTIDERTLLSNDLKSLFTIPQGHMIELLYNWNVISEDVKNKLHRISGIRNTYVHPDIIPDLETITGRKEIKKNSLEILTLLKYILTQSFSAVT